MIDDPLGLGLALLALLALALFGSTLAPGRFQITERWRTRTIAAALIAGVAIALIWNARSVGAGVDLAPASVSTAAVPGEWRDGNDTVTFRGSDYECRGPRCTGMSHAGRWQRVGQYGVRVRWSDGHEVTWRIVGYKGQLRLALLPLEGDVGPIDGRLYYAKVQ